MRKRFCKRGHDTYETGRHKGGTCSVCRRVTPKSDPVAYEEFLVDQERLPFAPLKQALDKAGIQYNPLGKSYARQIHRYIVRGVISVMSADQLCFDLLGRHPYDIYGPDFFESKAA